MKHKKSNTGKQIINLIRSDSSTNAVIICLLYFFTGINFIGSGVRKNIGNTDSLGNSLIALGIIMLIVCVISYFDQRKEMRSAFSTLATGIMHLLMAVLISLTDTVWWIAIYLLEIILTWAWLLLLRKKK